MTTLTKLKEKANLLEIDLNMLTLMPMHGMKDKSKEVRVVCEKFQRSISEKNWVNCIVLLGEIEDFERYYRNWLIDRGEEEDDEVLEKMHEYIVDLEIGIEKRLREGEEECREEHVDLVRLKNPSFKDSLRQKFSMNEEI
jgi:hypothetical protein